MKLPDTLNVYKEKGDLYMNDYKTLSALSYFSVFFAPFLLPLIIFFASSNEIVKKHAKRAFLSHLLPVIAGIAVFIIFVTGAAFGSMEQNMGNSMFFVWIILVALYGILSLAITIWNVVQGIRVLR